jgi:hypothetical protein
MSSAGTASAGGWSLRVPSLLLEGRFVLGAGSGEALNEHVLGVRWPEAPVRLEMLEEAARIGDG